MFHQLDIEWTDLEGSDLVANDDNDGLIDTFDNFICPSFYPSIISPTQIST